MRVTKRALTAPTSAAVSVLSRKKQDTVSVSILERFLPVRILSSFFHSLYGKADTFLHSLDRQGKLSDLIP